MDSRDVQKFSKGKKIRVNESYWEKQNNVVKRSQQKERENTNTDDDNMTPSTRDKIENLKIWNNQGNTQNYDFSIMDS